MITIVDTFEKWLLTELEDRGWSQRELSRKAGISASMTSAVIAGTRNPGWDFCAAIATPLGKTPMEVFQLAGLLPGGGGIRQLSDLRAEYYARSISDEEADLLDNFRLLPAYGRRAVKALAKTLVADADVQVDDATV